MFAVGLARSSGPRRSPKAVPILVGSAGVGLIGAGVFVTDPVSGYPPGTPDQGIEPTGVGWLHQVFSLPVLVGLPAAAAIEAGTRGDAATGSGRCTRPSPLPSR